MAPALGVEGGPGGEGLRVTAGVDSPCSRLVPLHSLWSRSASRYSTRPCYASDPSATSPKPSPSTSASPLFSPSMCNPAPWRSPFSPLQQSSRPSSSTPGRRRPTRAPTPAPSPSSLPPPSRSMTRLTVSGWGRKSAWQWRSRGGDNRQDNRQGHGQTLARGVRRRVGRARARVCVCIWGGGGVCLCVRAVY